MWADDAVLAGLVRALNDVLCPQAHLCSSGRGKQLSRPAIARLIKARAGDGHAG
jgi:hypothetical protein